ncbi:DUF4435 domain-containing protein [Enterobacter hormaechei subsp. xiangfangensis]|nr:DUF4435 domain-containing protein [Enterobacter hormaechei subsp. xiangfangensis]
MTEFEDINFSEEYLEVYCVMAGHNGFVFVEGLKDIAFWEGLLNDKDNDIRFDICNPVNKGTKGKPVLKKFMSRANRYAIFAMDSDFDYVCPKNSTDSEMICSNKYIFQTFVYSKESIELHHDVLEHCLSQIKLATEIKFNFKAYITEYSQLIYPVLKKFLLLKQHQVRLDDSAFHEAIAPSKPQLTNQFVIRNAVFETMLQSIAAFEEELDKLFQEEYDADKFYEQLYEKGLKEDNAYQYINGHFLADRVVMPVIQSLIEQLNINETAIIVTQCKEKPTLISERKRELKNILETDLNVNTLLNCCKEKFKTPCAIAIKESVARVLA